MKKIAAFSMAFAASFFIFIAVALAVLLLSGALDSVLEGILGSDGQDNNDRRTEGTAAEGTPEVSAEAESLLLIFEGDGEVFLSLAELQPAQKNAEVAELLPLAKDTENAESTASAELYEKLNSEGIFVFFNGVRQSLGKDTQYYIKFNAESFAKIADRTGGLVYNEDGREFLLTGSQAAGMMNGAYFAEACETLLENAMKKDAVQEFIFAANTTVNNLSYPAFYDFYFQ